MGLWKCLGAVAALLRGEHERAAAYFARWTPPIPDAPADQR